jgi:tetratricopeptide (TPR) repeat protein
LTDYDRAIELDPTAAVAFRNRGLARERQGDLEGALADYTKAIELDPRYALADVGRARLELGSGDVASAMTDQRDDDRPVDGN